MSKEDSYKIKAADIVREVTEGKKGPWILIMNAEEAGALLDDMDEHREPNDYADAAPETKIGDFIYRKTGGSVRVRQQVSMKHYIPPEE